MKNVFCQKYQQTLPALTAAPFPGPLGARIAHDISAQAWESWLSQQTILMNEYRLNPLDPKHKQQLQEAMLNFLYHNDEKKPDAHQDQT